MLRKLSLLIIILRAFVHVAASACTNVTFSISATADNEVFTNRPSQFDEIGLMAFLRNPMLNITNPTNGTTQVTGTFDIVTTYCAPDGQPRGVLEVLVHGLTFTRGVWSCWGFSTECDWQAYAADQGYHTLAIDRLGNGDSTRPADPFEGQAALQLEVIHQIITSIRAGTSPLDEVFDKIVYAGYSSGSFLGNALSRQYPADIDALVLTGYSSGMVYPVPLLLFNLVPARYVTIGSTQPFYSLPAGYATAAYEENSNNALYNGSFSNELAHIDWLNRNTGSVGEIATSKAGFGVSNYTGPLMLVTGDMDPIFCNPVKGPCQQTLEKTRSSLFPRVPIASLGLFVAPNTAHGVLTHDSAPMVHQNVHQFLNSIF